VSGVVTYIKRRDFKRRSRIDAFCAICGSMTLYCDIDDDGGPAVTQWLASHSTCFSEVAR